MGLWRVIWTGIVGMIFLALTSWISFQFLDLTSSVTGGLIEDLNVFLGSLGLIIALLLYFLLPLIPVIGPLIGGLIDGAVTGFTDLPYVLAVSTAILEGCLVGAVFGGFIGALKYKPTGEGGKQKSKKSKVKTEEDKEPTLDGYRWKN